MRYLPLFLAAALFASKPAAAQLAAAAAAPAAVAVPATPVASAAAARPATAPDTALALHRLFEVKRRRRAIIMGGTVGAGAAMLGGVMANEASRPEKGSQFGPNMGAVAVMAVCVVGAPVLLIETITLGGWGETQEQRVVAAWQQHQLPKKYYHHLNAKHGQYFR